MSKISEIGSVEIEHGFGAATSKPFVVLRVLDPTGQPVALEQMTVDDATSIAVDLLRAAGRASYEGDLYDELSTRCEMPDKLIGIVMFAARQGEQRREEG